MHHDLEAHASPELGAQVQVAPRYQDLRRIPARVWHNSDLGGERQLSQLLSVAPVGNVVAGYFLIWSGPGGHDHLDLVAVAGGCTHEQDK